MVNKNSTSKSLVLSVRKNTKRNGRSSAPRHDSTAMAVGNYASDAFSLARRTAYGLNEIRKLINIETKFIDISTILATSRAGTMNYLPTIAQGTNVSDRVGNSVKIQSIEIRGAVISGGANCFVRLLLVRDVQNRGGDPAGSDILQTVGVAGAPFSPTNYVNGPQQLARFAILYDSLFAIDTVADPSFVFDIALQHEGHIKFTGTTNASAASGAGALYLVAFTDLAATTPTVQYQSRIYYTDD